MRATVIVLVAGLASACAHQPMMWVKDGATEASFQKDKLECEYEAQKSVQSYDPSMRTTFGQELDLAMRRTEVAVMCMRVRGYTQVSAPPR